MNYEELVKEKWHLYGRWLQAPLSGTFWPYFRQSGFSKDLGKLLGVEAPRDIFIDGYHLTHEADNNLVNAYLVEAYEKGKLSELHDTLENASKNAEERHLALLTSQGLSDLEYLRELFASYKDVVGSWSFLFRFSTPLEERVIADGTVSTDDEMLLQMKPFVRTTWLEKQAIDIADMAQLPEDSAELSERIRAHVAEFSWFGTHHWEGDGYTEDKCLADIAAQRTKAVPEMRTEVASAPKGDVSIWKLLALFAYWRTHCAEMSAKVIHASRSRLERVARGWSLTYTELLNLSHSEILMALEKDATSIVLPDNYMERSLGWGVYLDQDGEKVITGDKLERLVDAVVPKVDTSVSEVKGTVASKGGVVKGVARVMLGPSDFSRFAEGDILVANETTPDFVPLMKKAAAIITDTGGITSHAAIVSRELKKPCVIGTKIATKVFKDGDMVEVDAEKGIVRKVQK